MNSASLSQQSTTNKSLTMPKAKAHLSTKRYPFSLIRPKELAQILGIAIPTLYKKIETEDDFPPRVKISKGSRGAVGFKKRDVEKYIEDRTEQKGEVEEVS